MELDEYVKTTLEQIIKGIKAAQDSVAEYGARINPQVREAGGRYDPQSGSHIQDVAFDVEVVATQTSKSGSGLKVGVPWVGGKIEAGSDSGRSHANRIKFVVPVVFPVQLVKKS